MRTADQLRDEVLAHGFDAVTYGPRVTAWLSDGLARIARLVRIPELEATSVFDTIPGERDVPLPAALVRLRSLRLVADADPLELVDLELLDQLPAANGKPEVWALSGMSARLHPTPNGAYSLELRYWTTPTELAGDVVATLPDGYADLLVTYALWRSYRAEDDFEAATFYRDEFDRALNVARGDIQQRTSSRPRQVTGLMGANLTPRGFIRP